MNEREDLKWKQAALIVLGALILAAVLNGIYAVVERHGEVVYEAEEADMTFDEMMEREERAAGAGCENDGLPFWAYLIESIPVKPYDVILPSVDETHRAR